MASQMAKTKKMVSHSRREWTDDVLQ